MVFGFEDEAGRGLVSDLGFLLGEIWIEVWEEGMKEEFLPRW